MRQRPTDASRRRRAHVQLAQLRVARGRVGIERDGEPVLEPPRLSPEVGDEVLVADHREGPGALDLGDPAHAGALPVDEAIEALVLRFPRGRPRRLELRPALALALGVEGQKRDVHVAGIADEDQHPQVGWELDQVDQPRVLVLLGVVPDVRLGIAVIGTHLFCGTPRELVPGGVEHPLRHRVVGVVEEVRGPGRRPHERLSSTRR